MSGQGHRLAALAERLGRAVPDGTQVRLPADDQLVASRQLVRQGGLARTGKSRRYVPGRGGYQITVACRDPRQQAEADALAQRAVPRSIAPPRWDPGTMRLRVRASEHSPQWTALNGRGEVVTVTVRCGSARVLDEVNRILAEIEAVLLS